MIYSIIPFAALFINFIVNFDVLFARKSIKRIPAYKTYRSFLLTVTVYFLCDALWGIFDLLNILAINYIVTIAFFVSMAISVYAWTAFVVAYLGKKTVVAQVLKYVGWGFMIAGVVILIINFFHPIMFEFVDGEYVSHAARYAFLFAQMLLFIIASIYVFIWSRLVDIKLKDKYIAIGFFGLIMTLAMVFQIIYPNLPVYSLGYILGLVETHTFVVAAEKREYQNELEEKLVLEQKQREEIVATKELAYTDPLTGIKNKHAYVEKEEELDTLIAKSEIKELSVIVFDLNDLKYINDNLGHNYGDEYIMKSVALIKKYFPNDLLYRFGGDEFVLPIVGPTYKDRHELLKLFNKEVDNNINTSEPIISTGISDYRPGIDNTYRAVFVRADERMYIRKKQLKGIGSIDIIEAKKNKEIVSNDTFSIEDELKLARQNNKKLNPRILFYKSFYHNEDYPLIDLLNNSSCDVMLEINTRDDSFNLLYQTKDKYFVPVVDDTYRDLYEYTVKNLLHPDDRELYSNFMSPINFFDRLRNNEIPNFGCEQFRLKLQDGSYRYVEQVVITGEENGIPEGSFRLYIFDVSNLKNRQFGAVDASNDLNKTYDSLTNLLVEKEFLIRAENLISINPDANWCLVGIDIEHFRFFDEWFGHEAGDDLIAKIGNKLKENEKELERVSGYFGKDDFAVLMPYNEEDINRLYEQIREVILSFGFTAGFLPAFGVAMIEKNMSVVDAFDRSAIASSKAKKDARNRICVYDTQMQFQTIKEYSLLSEFIQGLKNNEVTFYLQPQCRISTGMVVGAEALARWIKPDGTLIPPGVFVPILEKYGFISDLDQNLWEKVCSWLREWIDKGNNAVPISLNVSRADIFTMDVAKTICEVVDKYKLPHKLIKIEITESSYVEATDLIDTLVYNLRKQGFLVFMDDFGSGYSSLNMLSNLKVDAIKLDAYFLHLADKGHEKGIHILESVVNMAKVIALPIIVEGVESKEQSDFLENLGCRYIQGYYFYKPMPIKDFEELIKKPNMIDDRGFIVKTNEQIRIREFLDKNIYSDSMLNNIIGSVAFYSWKGDKTDIVRFNEQFYESVNVADFADRLTNIERWMPAEDIPKMHEVLRKAMENKLNGAEEILRFYKQDGTLSSYSIRFYHLGKKEGGERFYGSAKDVTELTDLREEIKLIANYSKDSLVFMRKVDNKWIYSVASRGLADVFDISPVELEKELNNGDFAKKRVANRKKFDMLFKSFAQLAAEKKNFESNFDVYDSSHHIVVLHLTFLCVSDLTNNIEYVLHAVPIY